MQIGDCAAKHIDKSITITRESWEIKGRLTEVTHGAQNTTDLKVMIAEDFVPHSTVELQLMSDTPGEFK
jgi:hypothetical protein